MIIHYISKDTGLDIKYIEKLVRSASHRYKDYTIPKRTGGLRLISHPSRELKVLQRWLVDNVFIYLPVHDSVYSYRKGRGIKNLASLHRKNKYLLKIDFQDFFPSITNNDISKLIKETNAPIPFSVSERDRLIINSIVCKDGRLTIGSPSSPIITNAILFKFDKSCYEKMKQKGIIYSRYSDDIYFSTNTPQILENVYEDIKQDIGKLEYPQLLINDRKTSFSSKKYRRAVTGLIITTENKISIGRLKKRYTKSLIHKFIEDQIDSTEFNYLRGFLSYVNSVEPTFIVQLEKKFGKEVIGNIVSAEIIKK